MRGRLKEKGVYLKFLLGAEGLIREESLTERSLIELLRHCTTD